MLIEDTSTLTSRRQEFAWRALIAVALIAAAALVWYTASVFLLAFGGVLLAIFLEFLAGKLCEVTPLSRGWAFAVVVVGIAGLLGVAWWYAIPHIQNQVDQLIRGLPGALGRLRVYLDQREWGRMVIAQLPGMLAGSNIPGEIVSVMVRLFDGLAAVVVIAVVALYVGAVPALYERGLTSLFRDHRERALDVFGEIGYALRWWLLGQLVPMVFLGVATGIGLWLLGLHLAFTLGLFTAFMVFVPYIGSLIALVVAVLVALVQQPALTLWVVILFLGVHLAEGYLITPMVQRRAVYVPPALTILAQVLMGLLLGFLGLALATPLTAATLVAVKMLYLHQRPEHHG